MVAMELKNKISKLRIAANLSQKDLAQKLGISQQALNKWENGNAIPDLEHLIQIAKYFGVTLDSLVFDSNNRIVEEMVHNKPLSPEYEQNNIWELYSAGLEAEYQQSIDEGKDILDYENLFKTVSKMPSDGKKNEIADILFNIQYHAPVIAGYPYEEPSDLSEIRRLLKENMPEMKLDRSELAGKIEGAWMGRIAGCLLGKPIEGIRSDELNVLLKKSNNAPMYRYILSTDVTQEMLDTFHFNLRDRCFADKVACAPADDDTNYTAMAVWMIEHFGKDFTPNDVLQTWVCQQGKDAYCTAERVAYKNYIAGYRAPQTAIYKNAYREWIGAQIRADYYGYINPCNPILAADMAWRDASISHVKNGIYGAMYVAAMLACAAGVKNIEDIIEGGLSQVPYTSRLYESVSEILSRYREGVSQKKCVQYIHSKYDENTEYGWCHTIPNAMIVTAALLYGKGNFGKSIGMAVETGFDTDCNGATVGSILGMWGGIHIIGKEWTDPLNGELETMVFDIGRKHKIKDLIERTLAQIDE